MAGNSPRKLDKKVLGNTTSATSKKGPHGGGNKYRQLGVGKGFMVHDAIPGHTQKKNIK